MGALPVLQHRRIPAVAFAVAGRIGGTNDWDQPMGAGPQRLLDAEGLRTVAVAGVEIGSHGFSHRSLTLTSGADLAEELERSAKVIAGLGLPRPRALSYPYGEVTAEVEAATREAGYLVGFTVTAGVAGPASPRYAVPRIEVSAGDTPCKLAVKVATAGWPRRRRELALRILRIDPWPAARVAR
jgi:peptidoglycan/xylan/chitin deacetylase (PgdA/CDA1 family)